MARPRDPISKALKAQSTHQGLNARLSVYERLGISKPGFWVDQGHKGTVADSDAPDYESLDAVAPDYEGLQAFEPREFEWGSVARKKPTGGLPKLYDGSVGVGGSGKGSPAATRQFKTQLNAVVANNWKSLGKAYPWTTSSSSNQIMAEKHATSYDLAQAFGQALRLDPHAMLNKVATDYYFAKSQAAAVSRANVPFGHLPTQFEKLQATLAKARQPIKGNTKGVSVQQMKEQAAKSNINMATTRLGSRGTGPRTPQLNVGHNSYANEYMGYTGGREVVQYKAWGQGSVTGEAAGIRPAAQAWR